MRLRAAALRRCGVESSHPESFPQQYQVFSGPWSRWGTFLERFSRNVVSLPSRHRHQSSQTLQYSRPGVSGFALAGSPQLMHISPPLYQVHSTGCLRRNEARSPPKIVKTFTCASAGRPRKVCLSKLGMYFFKQRRELDRLALALPGPNTSTSSSNRSCSVALADNIGCDVDWAGDLDEGEGLRRAI
jgi:hypothetical protein